MANVKSLSDLNGDGSDEEGSKFNEYYAGGEKRCASRDDDSCLQQLCMA
jgi:hypothetical protein